MLELRIAAEEFYNDETEEFISTKEEILLLEHSLVSLSKWESKWEIPFLDKGSRTDEQTVDYIRCMNLAPVSSEEVFAKLNGTHFAQISSYIDAKMTATTVRSLEDKPGTPEVITAELIYYWMISLQVPMECQYWHLNRLLTMIKVVNFKNSPKSKSRTGRADMLAHRRALNEQRRAAANSKG